MITATSVAESMTVQTGIDIAPSQVQTSRRGYRVAPVTREDAHTIGRSVLGAFGADPESGPVTVSIFPGPLGHVVVVERSA